MTLRTQFLANLVAMLALIALTMAIPLVDQATSRFVAQLPVVVTPASAR
jgi:hypothetical protein